jgi:hypothetical protein
MRASLEVAQLQLECERDASKNVLARRDRRKTAHFAAPCPQNPSNPDHVRGMKLTERVVIPRRIVANDRAAGGTL